MAKHYPDVNPNPDFAAVEQGVLDYWQEKGLFQRSVDNRASAKEFIFYDGPPFANGLPHYGHLLTGYVKDVFARYQTMRGQRVERRFGWDCHGLPAEMGSEKELGISGRAAIQNYGIDKFNEHCRSSVMKYTSEWEYYVTRQARWVDFKNDYKTMDSNFMESVLWAFKQLYDKGLVYEAFRVSPYSWAAESTVSNFETKMDNSYREREDKAITVAFELNEKPAGAPDAEKYYVLAWTTTPWTLPSNLALAVGDSLKYGCIVKDNACYILNANSFGKYAHELNINAVTTTTDGSVWQIDPNDIPKGGIGLNEIGKLIDEGKGISIPCLEAKDLIGLTYKPLFPYFANRMAGGVGEGGMRLGEDPLGGYPNAFRIINGSSFVTDGDGTGIVHIAPGFGEDDKRVADANNIPTVVPVDGQGKYTDAIYDLPNLSLKGLNVIAQSEGANADEPYKPEQLKKYGLSNLRIINWLKNEGKLIKQEEIKHNYPHCWRTDQPLIYRAMPSWYVEVTKFRDRAAELNKQINWIPEHVRDGQMGHMLSTAPDWSISRNRFWGTPIPVWRAKSGKIIVCGSIAEIEQLSGKKVPDLHRPYIDSITIEKDGEVYTRVEDVFDCWFESGSMPFAQVHYPFENKEWFEEHFPADFITEYVGQTRGWFNTLIMLSTALFDRIPFKNCICHGVVLDSETGLKYSKRLKNYRDPKEVMDKFGADALRWMMLASPVMRGADIMVDPDGKFIRDVVRLAIKPIWNAYNFFCLYANADGIKAKADSSSQDIMDRYILAKCRNAAETIQTALDSYDTPTACEAVLQFFEVLNNWYIRRSKERFWSNEASASKQAAYDTLYTVLDVMCRAAAPLLPLTCEEIYKGLTGTDSVHLTDFPDVSAIAQSADITEQMDFVQDICNAALSVRNTTKIRVRQPLQKLEMVGKQITNNSLLEIILSEVNVKECHITSASQLDTYATKKLAINSQVLGKRLPALMKQILPASKKGEWKAVDGTVEICGEKLLPGEFTLQLEPKPEYKDRAAPLSSNDALVILDTTITPELEAEGIARDVVRMIQQARKDANLNVSDKIALFIDAPAGIKAALDTHAGYIKDQTLTAELLASSPSPAAYSTQVELDEHKLTIALKLAA